MQVVLPGIQLLPPHQRHGVVVRRHRVCGGSRLCGELIPAGNGDKEIHKTFRIYTQVKLHSVFLYMAEKQERGENTYEHMSNRQNWSHVYWCKREGKKLLKLWI